jgi:hypothetical protein
MAENGDDTFPPQGRRWRKFIGSVSPVGNMLAVLTGAARLLEVAREVEAPVVIYDTTGCQMQNLCQRIPKEFLSPYPF